MNNTVKIGVLSCVMLMCLYNQATGAEGEPIDTANRKVQDSSEYVNALAGEDAVARFMAETQLIDMGDDAVPILEPLAASPGVSIARHYAVNILARIASQDAIDLLLRILDQEPEVKVRAWICRHLGQLGVEQAVPIIGKWLFTIQGKSLTDWDGPYVPHILTVPYAWMVHVYALREIGSEQAIPILEEMLKTKHGGVAGDALTKTYQKTLSELRREAAFWRAIRPVPGLEEQVKRLFQFFRIDTLARMRLYRDKVVRLSSEGRWVLEGMENHTDVKLQRAAKALLKVYDEIRTASHSD